MSVYHHPYCKDQIPLGVTHSYSAYGVVIDSNIYLDACSNLYNSPFGFKHRVLHDAAIKQLSMLDVSHTMSIGAGIPILNNPAKALVNDLLQIQEDEFGKRGKIALFNSGSESIDFALGAVQFINPSIPLTVFMLDDGYHGMSSFLANVKKIKIPVYAIDSNQDRNEYLDQVYSILSENTSELSCLLYEGCLSANGGVLLDSNMMQSVLQLCNGLGIKTIIDEIVTGFGRLTLADGNMFVSGNQNHKDYIAPDMICFSKQISNGILALSGVIINDKEMIDITVGKSGVTNGAGPVQSAVARACLAEIQLASTRAQFINNVDKISAILQRICSKYAGLFTSNQLGMYSALHFIDGTLGMPLNPQYKNYGEMLSSHIFNAGTIVRGNHRGVNIAPGYLFTESDMQKLETSLDTGIASFLGYN